MSEHARETLRAVELTRTEAGRYRATNVRGGEVVIGSGDDADFSPVELLLAALAGCTAIDVDLITSRRAEPTGFDLRVHGHKVRDEGGSHLVDLGVRVEVTFPDGEAGDDARAMLPRAVRHSAERGCTVGRTLQLGTSISYDVR
jgi:putative redox protein